MCYQKKIHISASGLQRKLQARHLTMIAIGGSIGTGLFVASGTSISQAGPGGALLSYVLIGLMVYFLMASLSELAAYMPVSGSFATYGSLYVEEGFGFALGWNYWYNWAVTIAVDLVASQLVMSYWFPTIPCWIWSALFLCITFLLNVISVKGFGEAEYWFALIKIITVVVFICIGMLMIFGILRSEEAEVGWHNWTLGDAPFAGGVSSMMGVAMIVGFSFQGTELIGIAAGEAVDPSKNIPRVVRYVFWRILLFYVLAILIISLIIPYTSPHILSNNVQDMAVSPFTLVFNNAGLLSAATVMNSVVLTAVLSAGNSGMYAATRMLYNLALEGKAPKIFASLSPGGIPRYALVMTTLVAALCFLSSLFSNQKVYMWLLNTSGMTGFIAWMGIAVSHYRFRRGYQKQGHNLATLPYRAKLFPLGPVLTLILCIVITLGQNYQAFVAHTIDWHGIIATYIGIPVFLLIWLGFRWRHGSRLIDYENMNFPQC